MLTFHSKAAVFPNAVATSLWSRISQIPPWLTHPHFVNNILLATQTPSQWACLKKNAWPVILRTLIIPRSVKQIKIQVFLLLIWSVHSSHLANVLICCSPNHSPTYESCRNDMLLTAYWHVYCTLYTTVALSPNITNSIHLIFLFCATRCALWM